MKQRGKVLKFPGRARARRAPTTVGFVVTPGEIANRIAALDNVVTTLDGDIRASSAPKLNALWRGEWDAFVRRWTVERDSYASWDARLFATRVMPRLDAFEASYRAWARQYRERTGIAPRLPDPAPVTGMADALVPSEVWWILGAAAALWVLTQTRKG